MAESIVVYTDDLLACAEQFRKITEDVSSTTTKIGTTWLDYESFWQGSFTKDLDRIASSFKASSSKFIQSCVQLYQFIEKAVDLYVKADQGLVPQEELGAGDYPSNVAVSPQGGVTPAQFQVLLTVLEKYKGAQYVWGAESTSEIDCSGLVMQAYKEAGIRSDLSHSTTLMYQQCTPIGTYPSKQVDLSQLKPGDLLFYSDGGPQDIKHVSIYLGNGQVMHALNPYEDVKITKYSYTKRSTIYAARV